MNYKQEFCHEETVPLVEPFHRLESISSGLSSPNSSGSDARWRSSNAGKKSTACLFFSFRQFGDDAWFAWNSSWWGHLPKFGFLKGCGMLNPGTYSGRNYIPLFTIVTTEEHTTECEFWISELAMLKSTSHSYAFCPKSLALKKHLITSKYRSFYSNFPWSWKLSFWFVCMNAFIR